MEGTVLAGRYRLLSKIGEGGMGSVWRAVHLTLGTPLAIKLIDPSIAQSTEALSRFKREAQSAAELRSVYVVQIIDYGVDDKIPFIAMEMLDGESLAARLDRVRRLSPYDTANILSQVARALVRAHGAGIVHRDLKPENIFLVPEGDDEIAKVLDFGIAKKLDALSCSSGVKTGTGAMLGTPYYMSPEQALGQTTIDHRTDIWSLGIIAYQCMTGVRPFDRDTLGALLMAICNDPLPTPSSVAQVPPGFDAWFARAAARNVAERYGSAADATTDLRKICDVTTGRPSSIPSIRGDTVASAPTNPASPMRAETPIGMEHTAVPSSVTIPGLKKTRFPGAALAVVGAVLVTIVLVFVGRAFLQRAPAVTSSTASLAPERTSLPPSTDSSVSAVTVALQAQAAVAVELASPSPSASERPPANKNVEVLSLRRTNPKTTGAKAPGATASAAAASPPPKPLAPAAKSAQPRNYDNSVGF